MDADNPLYSDTSDDECKNNEHKKQSRTTQCTLTDVSSYLTKDNETYGEYDGVSNNDECDKEQKEKANKSTLNESFIFSDKEHDAYFNTCNIKPQESPAKYHDISGYSSDLSGSPKHEEDNEYFIQLSGSISSQEDIEYISPTSSLTKQHDDIGYFSHSSGSTSHSSSSEKLVQDSDQIINEDDDDCPNNAYISSSSKEIKQDNQKTVTDVEPIHFDLRQHISFAIKNEFKEEWHAPAAPSNSPTEQGQINIRWNYKSDVEDDPFKFCSVNELAYEKSSFSKKHFFTPRIPDESKLQDSFISNVFKSKSLHLGNLRGRSTPPLPPNTLAPPSQVTPTATSVQVRYPPPNTSAIYYDSLPTPKEEEFINVKEKEKIVEQEEFINVLRDKLQKLQPFTEGSKNKKYHKSDVCDTNYEDDDNEECNVNLKRPPLKRQASFAFKLPQKNLSNLTEVLSTFHTTQTEQKKCESLPYEESLTENLQEESNITKKTLKKSSSLKYNKTPPDQKEQSKKKIVKFADVFGMDLVEVRTFMAGTPAISPSSFTDTQVELPASTKTRSLRSLFDAPIAQPNFWERVNNEKVSLEQMFLGKDLSVKGIIRVLNITCDKRVTIKHSFDNWKNYHETTATYLSGSSDGRTDQFSFLLWGNFLQDNGTLVFCIRYQTAGQEYWDNNHGEDYKLQCYAMPSHAQGQGLERSSRSRQQASQYQMAQAESLYSNFERLREHSPADPWLQRYL